MRLNSDPTEFQCESFLSHHGFADDSQLIERRIEQSIEQKF